MAYGGLGGLGGWNQTFGDILSGLGQSLLSSPSNNMFQNFPQALQGQQARRKEQRSDEAMVSALISAGLPPEKAMALAANPTAAALVINQQNQTKQQAFREKALGGMGPLTPPGAGATLGGGISGSSDLDAITNGITAAESGGDYNARGPMVTQGNYAGERAIGRYQVMPGNVPDWTEEHLGKRMKPEEFARNPEAQDNVFQGEMRKNLAQYGTIEDAASIWFTGKPYAQASREGATDGFMKVQDYVAKVKANTGGGTQVAASGKMPVPLPARELPTPDTTAPAGANRTQSWANAEAQKALGLMVAAGDDKGLLEAAKQRFEMVSKYLTPTDAQRNLQAAGISPTSVLGRDILSGGATINREKLGLEREKQTLDVNRFDYERMKTDRAYTHEVANANRTESIKNYDAYAAQERQAGREPVSRYEFSINLARAGSNSPETIEQAERGKGLTKFLNAEAERAPALAQRSADLDTLSRVLQKTPTGAGANVRAFLDGVAAEIGLSKGTLASQADAISAIANRIAPSLRAPGSGAQSDSELAGFLRSLPGLTKTPEGNRLIEVTIKRAAAIDNERADLAVQWQTGEISGAVARKRMAELDRQSLWSNESERRVIMEAMGQEPTTRTETPGPTIERTWQPRKGLQ